MGHEYVEMKNPKASIEAYRNAVGRYLSNTFCLTFFEDINPRDYRAWYGLGQTYEIIKMFNYALYYYNKAATLRYLNKFD